MTSPIVSRARLNYAQWADVLRLARSLRIKVYRNGCQCMGHRRGLIERIARACR